MADMKPVNGQIRIKKMADSASYKLILAETELENFWYSFFQ